MLYSKGLLEAAKKTDAAFGVAPQTTAHTIRDPGSDVSKMVKQLVENKVSLTVEDRLSPAFTDPTKATKNYVVLG